MRLERLATAPSLPHTPLWQSAGWAAFQTALGREIRWYRGGSLTGLVVIDRTVGGYATWDLPRGPLLAPETTPEEAREFLELLTAEAKVDRALALYWSGVDPRLAASGYGRPSPRHEQPEATILVDLTLSDDALLNQMHQKGRYNVRLAQKHGVTVEQSADVGAYVRLAQETSARDGFRAPSGRHFEHFLKNVPGSFLLLAFAPGIQGPIAGLIGVAQGETGIYYYGASRDTHRNLMAPYLLQWEAMRHCRTLGCRQYDFLGVAPANAGPTHPWQGISAFKAKFGGTFVTYPTERIAKIRPLIASGLRLKRLILG